MGASPEPELKIAHEEGAGGRVIRLTGTIDLNFPRAKLVELAKEVVVFDLEGVQRITSYGVREWIKTLRELTCEYYCFVKCRPAMIMQFNLVAGFAGKGELLSFYLPYVCPECDEYDDVLMDVRTQYGDLTAFSVPAHKCKKCGAEAEFDDAPQAYLSYAAKMKAPAPPPIVDALLTGKAKSAAPFKVEKHVSESITAMWLSGSLDTTARFKRLADGLEGTVILLLGGVATIAPKALAQLRPFFDSTAFESYVARIGKGVAEVLAAEGPGVLGRARVATLMVPFRCSACEKVTDHELDALELRHLGADGTSVGHGPSRACPACGAKAVPAIDGATLAMFRKLEPVIVPVEVRAYLSNNSSPPPAEGTIAGGATPSQSGLPAVATNPATSGRYEIIRRLGAGGMAEVFLAKQTSVGGFAKKVVLKRILPHLSNDQEFVSMFLSEAKTAARIAHPNVTEIYDVWQDGSQFLIAMEYIRGWDLNVVLKTCKARNERIPVHLAASIISQVCHGLHAAHTCTDDLGQPLQIVHRDVSPHNVLIATTGQAKISDFGIAKASDSSSKTPSNQLKGKLAYMAPEQASGDGDVDARADVFPAGLMLFQCLTLDHMFERASDMATFQAILHDPIPKLADRLPDVPAELQAILEKAIARDPAQRYQTARAMADDLDRLVGKLGRSNIVAELSEWLLARMPAIEDTPAGSIGQRKITGDQTVIRDRSQG
jgi:hypothetical protein